MAVLLMKDIMYAGRCLTFHPLTGLIWANAIISQVTG